MSVLAAASEKTLLLLTSNTEKMISQIIEAELTNLSNVQHLRHYCDTDADIALSVIQRQPQNESETEPLPHKHDLFSVLKAGSPADPVFAKL